MEIYQCQCIKLVTDKEFIHTHWNQRTQNNITERFKVTVANFRGLVVVVKLAPKAFHETIFQHLVLKGGCPWCVRNLIGTLEMIRYALLSITRRTAYFSTFQTNQTIHVSIKYLRRICTNVTFLLRKLFLRTNRNYTLFIRQLETGFGQNFYTT